MTAAAKETPWSFVLLLTVCVVLTFRLARLEGWDEAFYVAQMTSLLGDGDLLLQDDLLAFPNSSEAAKLRTVTFTTTDGALASSMFGIGPAVLHSFYLWPLILGDSELGRTFTIAIGFGSMALLAMLALSMRSLLLHLGHEAPLASLCSLLAIYCGPLAIYGTRLYLNSHLPAAACATLVMLLAWSWAQRGGNARAALLGFFCGLAALVRFQDALVGAAFAPFLLVVAWRRGERRGRAARELALGAVVLALVLAVQFLAFERQLGRSFGIPQGPGYVHWTNPQIGFFLFSTFHGLFPWAPAFALGLLAVPLAAFRSPDPEKRLFLGCLALLVALECYVSATPTDWWGGSSFGARRLSTLSAASAIGLAALLGSIRARFVTATLVTLACAWALFVASLHTVQVDDLSLVFRGAPAAENPFAANAYPKRLAPGDLLRYARGSFSLAGPSRPSLPQRMVGAGWCALVCVGVALAWTVASRHRRVLTGLAAASTAWALMWAVAVWRVPSNALANQVWLGVSTGTASGQELSRLPPEVAAAGRVVLAWKALRQGRLDDGRRLLADSKSTQFPSVGLADLAILDEAKVAGGER